MKFYWKIPNSDNFTTASEWTPASVPGAFDQVLLTGTGTAYDVNVTTSQTVLTIGTSLDATLNIIDGTFTAEDGTGSGANNGKILVTNASFDVAGTINNNGTIELMAGGGGAELILLGDTTLNGGTLKLDSNAETFIAGGGMLTNTGNAHITGASIIDVPIDNKATIDGNNATSDLQLDATVTNTGEMLGESNPGLILTTTVNNIGGLIEANAGLVQLGVPGTPGQPGTIIGGTIDNLGGNFLLEVGSLDGSGTHPITVIGQMNIDDDVDIDVAGAFKTDGGIFALNTDSSLLLGLSNVAAVDTTFSGGGQIEMSSALIDLNPSTHAGSVPPKLNNVDDFIGGTGTIGNAVTPGAIVLNNETKGTVGALSDTLTIYSNVTNAGLLDSTNGTLSLVGNVITNTSTGSLTAFSGADIALQNATIRGGKLNGLGEFDSDDAVLDGSTAALTNAGTIDMQTQFSNQTLTLTLEGTINNAGTMELFPYSGSAGTGSPPNGIPIGSDLVIGAAGKLTQVTLKGAGTIALDAYGSDYIIGDANIPGGVPTTLDNVSNFIQGAGRIGDDGLTLKNSGEIQGTGSSPLVIDTGSRTVTNTGTLNATNNGELYINSPLNNSGGKLTARFGELVASQGASGGTATLSPGATIEFGGPTTIAVQFDSSIGASKILVLDDSVHFKGVIGGFGKSSDPLQDTIDLNDIDSSTAHKVSFAGGVLTVKDGSGHTAQLHFSGSYTINSFNLSDDGHGGTQIVDPPVAPPANAALFGHYLAAAFPTAVDAFGGLLTKPEIAAPLPLALPHH